MPQPLPGTARSSRSARVKAQRPQLVPRASVPEPDPDVDVVRERTPAVEQWDSPAPMSMANVMLTPPADAVPTPHIPLTLTPSTIYHIDQLWDWCRDDPTGTQAFLGFAPDHSRALQDYMGKLLTLEQKGFAVVRTVVVDGNAIGIVTLMPINREVAPPYGNAHCYLMPALQGHLPQLLPGILAEAARLEPTLMLRVSTPDYAFARLLQPHGFTLSIVLTRPAHIAHK